MLGDARKMKLRDVERLENTFRAWIQEAIDEGYKEEVQVIADCLVMLENLPEPSPEHLRSYIGERAKDR